MPNLGSQLATTLGGWGYGLAVGLALVIAAGGAPRERSPMGHSGSGTALFVLTIWGGLSLLFMGIWYAILHGAAWLN